jgi:hypothetical protein
METSTAKAKASRWGKDGEMATGSGQGVGTMKRDGSVSYRGAILLSQFNAEMVRLNTVAAIFEYVSPDGNVRAQLWEWN